MKIAAPFFGEFGWEIAMWIPYLRRRAHNGESMVVFCLPRHEYLYEDFAQKVCAIERPKGKVYQDCQNCWIDGVQLKGQGYIQLLKKVQQRHSVKVFNTNVIMPEHIQAIWDPCPRLTPKGLAFAYGEATKEPGWIGICARSIPGKQEMRNWSREKWEKLIARLHAHQQFRNDRHIVCFGTKKHAMSFSACEDLRERPLSEECLAMSKCEVVVGPSSGPLHLANMCKTPVVWWTPHEKNEVRYKKAWNYFGMPNEMAAPLTDPSVAQVFDAIGRVRDGR